MAVLSLVHGSPFVTKSERVDVDTVTKVIVAIRTIGTLIIVTQHSIIEIITG